MHEIFKALADETRLKILIEIMKCSDEDSICACHIKNVECSQSTKSHHLKVLTDAKIINKKKVGKYHHYCLNQEELALIFEFIANYEEIDVCD